MKIGDRVRFNAKALVGGAATEAVRQKQSAKRGTVVHIGTSGRVAFVRWEGRGSPDYVRVDRLELSEEPK